MNASAKNLRTVCGLIASAALIATGCGAKSEQTNETQAQPLPPAVSVQTVERRNVPVHDEYAGRAKGAREVEVRARVESILLERLYTEGEVVEKGDTLWQIDPEPFEIALRRAQAELANAQANLRQAEREWERVADLFEENAVSERERDQALSALELAEANVAMAQAQVAQAEIDLGYTEVNAPLKGATSLEVRPEGSLVRSGDLLTTITQLDPIHVLFSLPEDDAVLQREAMQAMTVEGDPGTRAATVILPTGDRYEHEGVVNFTNSTIDPATGTVQARAVFPNAEGGLIPGQFVRVSVRKRTLTNAIVVPERAVAAGAEGPVVYVIDDENIARAQPVALGPRVQGGQIISSGLGGGERIVVGGIVKVSDGVEVMPQAAKKDQDSAA
jgi:membrane fusion protein, multidrug efflux system